MSLAEEQIAQGHEYLNFSTPPPLSLSVCKI